MSLVRIGMVIAACVVALDQVTKHFADTLLQFHQPLPVLPFLDLTLTYNRGAAFSFLSEASGWQRWFFTVLAIAASVFIVFWMKRLKPEQKLLGVSFALILGGAVGNLIDRLLYGYVIDFVDFYYGTWHFPAFNAADSAISVGAALLLIESLRGEKKNR